MRLREVRAGIKKFSIQLLHEQMIRIFLIDFIVLVQKNLFSNVKIGKIQEMMTMNRSITERL